MTDRNRNVELRRIAIDAARRGRGLGRLALRAVVARAFDANAHRVWLDVKEANQRAQWLYASEGFVREGLLRGSLLEGDGSCSLADRHVAARGGTRWLRMRIGLRLQAGRRIDYNTVP